MIKLYENIYFLLIGKIYKEYIIINMIIILKQINCEDKSNFPYLIQKNISLKKIKNCEKIRQKNFFCFLEKNEKYL